MNTPLRQDSNNAFRITSNIHDDIWHADAETAAYEWWYFDAVSEDGRDVLVIIFLTNFIFSPRYNRATQIHRTPLHDAQSPPRFPAVVCCLYRDGRPLIRSITEHAAHDFTASTAAPACRIGGNSFEYVDDENGARYELKLDVNLRGRRRFQASFAWRILEASLTEQTHPASPSLHAHEWNMVAPRCRVEGVFSITDRRDFAQATKWIGTGYHDHNRDTRPPATTITGWQWGRAHFPDATAIFYRFQEQHAPQPVTRLLITRDHQLTIHPAQLHATRPRFTRFGLCYPREMRFEIEEEYARLALHITQRSVIDASFFYLRFFGHATLDFGDGRTQRAPLIAEHLAPRALRWRWLDWLVNMRIGRNGRTSFLP